GAVRHDVRRRSRPRPARPEQRSAERLLGAGRDVRPAVALLIARGVRATDGPQGSNLRTLFQRTRSGDRMGFGRKTTTDGTDHTDARGAGSAPPVVEPRPRPLAAGL